MDNIFEGAKFGDKFLTRDGRIALYVMNDNSFHVCVVTPLYNKNPIFWSYNADGTSLDEALTDNGIDIVSKYQEPIDEEKIYLEARKNCDNYVGDYRIGYLEGYKDGYCKAMEE